MPTAQQLVGMGFGGYQGWGDAEANADYNATKGSGKGQLKTGGSSGGSGNFDYNSFLSSQQEAQKAAIQPAIQSLQASIPNIQKSYATQVGQKQASIEPLTKRYDELISSIKGTGETQVNQQTAVTAGELGKRGIEGSSTLAGQEISSAVAPIRQQYTTQMGQLGSEREAAITTIQDAIANLNNNQRIDEGAVQTAIAQLQSGAGQSAISNANSVLNTQMANQPVTPAASKNQTVTIGKTTYSWNPDTNAMVPLGSNNTETSNANDILALLKGNTNGAPSSVKTTPTEPEPMYSTANGSLSNGKGWIFINGQWVETTQ